MTSLFTWILSVLTSILETIQLAFWATSPVDFLEHESSKAKNYEEWRVCQAELDSIQGKTDWPSKEEDRHYDFTRLSKHKEEVEKCRINGDNAGLANQLRGYSSRNICRILSPALYRKSKITTKTLIHDYLGELSGTILHLSKPESMLSTPTVLSSQDKRRLFSEVRQALGRTTLVLQGGSTFSMCQLGVAKALYLQNLLPQVITGTATGALVSALICSTPPHDLRSRLRGAAIDLSSFHRAKLRRQTTAHTSAFADFFATLVRRSMRLYKTGHLFDIEILKECAKDNLGDVTFHEAYVRSGRILNITVALSDVPGMPQLLNYITAPHVYVWSAVVASIASSKRMYAPVSLMCRDEHGNSTEYFASDANLLPPKFGRAVVVEPPLKRVGELFNVNHFIIVQTRPYVIPFIRLQTEGASGFSIFRAALIRLLFNEALHWLHRLSRYGYLPPFFSRLLLDETVPGGATAAPWSKTTITPDLGFRDLAAVFEIPNSESLNKWSRRGERSTWPSINELRVRCGIEFELDAAHESVRRGGQAPAPAQPRPL